MIVIVAYVPRNNKGKEVKDTFLRKAERAVEEVDPWEKL